MVRSSRIVTGVGTEIDAQDVDARLYGCATGLGAVPSEEVVQTLGDWSESGYFAPGEVEDFHSRFAGFGFQDDEPHLQPVVDTVAIGRECR